MEQEIIHTFLVLAYKESPYLENAVKSVLNQEYPSKVVIGTSTDNEYIRSIADKYHLDVNYLSLIRGALLHDYFLYDWHEKNPAHSPHGFKHPRFALDNARQDCSLTAMEENIILRHMFPLTPAFPAYKESWIVSLADKICASAEMYQNYKQRLFASASAK